MDKTIRDVIDSGFKPLLSLEEFTAIVEGHVTHPTFIDLAELAEQEAAQRVSDAAEKTRSHLAQCVNCQEVMRAIKGAGS